MKKLLFALDFDGTYTEDPELWNNFITLLKQKGHSVIVATMRYPSEAGPVREALEDKVDAIIYTSRKAKYEEVQKQGYTPNIWIDDMPHFLFQGG